MIGHLSPAVFYKVWGGERLSKLKSLPQMGKEGPLGETWEISLHHEGKSHHGKLPWKISENEELTYLVKFIDTSSELSVQVHPDDEYALLNEKCSGKSECWVVLEAEKNAGVYLGLRPGVSKEFLKNAITSGVDLSQYLNHYKVSPGDFFYVPAGTIHAIGGGITLAEVQQNSGITYRVWDWNRLDTSGKPRPLHIEKSLDVINFSQNANVPDYFKMSHGLFEKKGTTVLIEHHSFKVSLVVLDKMSSIEISSPEQKRVKSLLNLSENAFEINGVDILGYQAAFMKNESHWTVKSGNKGLRFLFIE